MFIDKEYIGLALDGDVIKLAHVKKEGNTLRLLKLDSFSLIEKIDKKATGSPSFEMEDEQTLEAQEADSGSVFGFDESEEPSLSDSSSEEDVDFEELEAQANVEDEEPDLLALDMVDEAEEGAQSNAILLYNILSDIDPKSVNVGLNIPAGETIFQTIRDTDFNEVKTKDLIDDLEAKLESIYGTTKSTDHYAYKIREDGSLVLASVEDEAPLLKVVNETKDFYSGKLRVKSIYPDEVALVNLVRDNYQLKPTELSAVLQFSPENCRIIFMQGDQIWQIPAVINQGTKNEGFLNTVFSKILFQLDTGKVPGIDQIILTNNTLGEEAVQFFRQNFPDLKVQEFEFNQEKFKSGNKNPEVVNAFTTAIAAAWAAAGANDDEVSELSFLPAYVRERQKIFKLQWHGLLLLILIFLSIPTINYFYQRNAAQIESLSSELELTEARITQIEPIVQSTNEISDDLALLTSKLALLDSLSTNSRAWSTKMMMLNQGMNGIPNSWFSSLSQTQDGTFIEGYTMYRNRIPAIVDLFAEATLLNVSIQEMREEEIFRFSIIVKEFAEDPSVYSPEKPESIEQILNN